MRVYQSRSFEKKVKKFSKQEKKILDKEVNIIVDNPAIGEGKRGDLEQVFIHKFKIKTVEHLLAYRIVDENLELIMLGLHENYYRDLKKYVKKNKK